MHTGIGKWQKGTELPVTYWYRQMTESNRIVHWIRRSLEEDMTEQEIDSFLIEKSFHSVKVNTDGIRVYYNEEAGICHLIILYLLLPPMTVTRQQQENVARQVKEKFEQAGFVHTELLNLAMTDNPQTVQGLFERGERFWILDLTGRRLMLYEDQEGDFCGLRRPLENILFQPEKSSEGELKQYLSLCNIVVIAANIIIFIFCEWRGSTEDTEFLFSHGALHAESVLDYHEYYRLFTYMFLHGGMEHLLNNMLILLFIGNNLEKTAGRIKYLLFYFGSGILAGAASVGYNISIGRDVVCVGASGAIFGTVGALAYIILVNRGKVENLTTQQIVLFVILSLYGGLTSQGVDNAAHIGGLAAGFLLALIFYRKPNEKMHQEGKEGKAS